MQKIISSQRPHSTDVSMIHEYKTAKVDKYDYMSDRISRKGRFKNLSENKFRSNKENLLFKVIRNCNEYKSNNFIEPPEDMK
jgi:hypothetical protein